VTVVPNLMVTVLALEKDARERLLATPIMKLVLFCPESVDTWLTRMLQRRTSARRGVDYLVAVSGLCAYDLFGKDCELSIADYATFRDEKERVLDAIGGLDGLVGSLVVLEEIELDRALQASVVWHIVSEKLSRPFIVSLVLIDFVLHLTLMLVRIRRLTAYLRVPGFLTSQLSPDRLLFIFSLFTRPFAAMSHRFQMEKRILLPNCR